LAALLLAYNKQETAAGSINHPATKMYRGQMKRTSDNNLDNNAFQLMMS